MADPPDHCTARATSSTTTTPALQLDAVAVRPEGANTTNMNIIATRTNTASVLNTNAAVIGDRLVAADGNAAVSPSVKHIATALMSTVATHESPTATLTGQRPGAVSEEQEAASANNNPSLFAKLPGELRNRIYRLYFEDSARQRKHTMDIKKAAPTFLNLFHTDHMIRSEATSIFFKEFLSIDSFFAPMNLEGAIMSRLKSICALAAIHKINLQLSITVQESIVGEAIHVSSVRSDFVGKLMRFITSETNEWFARSTDLNKPEEGTHPPSDQSMRLESMAHSSHSYRIERLHPDATSVQWMPELQRNAGGVHHIHGQQFLGVQGAYQPIRDGADFLRVE